ncbi:protein C12orf4 homolog [Saccostrea echinata]|uniref:protein C12orf4 homolog n=2 Tax=Saccostrea TaxID=33508 RepID=UPI002A82BB61|nr:protein C12orf4 homolog [Saccostrea echinata]XP_061175242.1 protein C12orf4 homolog [Saccostrea echinata]
MSGSKVVDFQYQFTSKNLTSTLTVPVTIPSPQSASDLVGRLINAHNLPCYVEEDLKTKLEEFVTDQTNKLYDENAEKALQRLKNGDISIDDVVSKWNKAFTEEVKCYAKPEAVTEEQVFSEVYHSLIHSPALDTLLNLEHTYALTIEDLIQQRDKDLEHLDERQREEMEDAMKNAGTKYTDAQVNQLAQRHIDNSQLISGKWSSELSNLKDTQKREFREWVLKVHEDTQSPSKSTSYLNRVRALSSSLPEAAENERGASSIRMEESFTIHLGAQMKTTHNLRLLCTDVLDLCRHKAHTVGGMLIPQPQRLQTAMSLYSNDLCAMIMMVDNRLNSYTGLKREFARVCEQSTDFHFPDLEQQFAIIEQELALASEYRQQNKHTDDADKASLKSSSSTSSEEKNNGLRAGDFYLTKHSNLSEVHVVFHLVADDGKKASESVKSSDISSRHPVILSIRNIIKLCFRYDINTLTIPLLLSNEMTEEMTIPWCQKRVELMFKCVKGFMMEMAAYGGYKSRNIQFLVPPGISEDMFSGISSMLQTIFRLSNPVVIK